MSGRIRHLRRGALHGWCAHCSAASRHRALNSTVRADGYAEAVERLGAIRRLDRHRDTGAARVAAADQRWLYREYRG